MGDKGTDGAKLQGRRIFVSKFPLRRSKKMCHIKDSDINNMSIFRKHFLIFPEKIIYGYLIVYL